MTSLAAEGLDVTMAEAVDAVIAAAARGGVRIEDVACCDFDGWST